MTADPFRGLHPSRPPEALRERVLAAARAAAERQPGLLEPLLADRALRWCALALVVLAIAHAAIDGHKVAPSEPIPTVPVVEGLEVAPESGLTAAEQMPDVAPLLEQKNERTRG